MVPNAKIKSHNGWDPLKEVIVGRADGSVGTLTWLSPDPIPEHILEEAKSLAQQACPQHVIGEVIEDLDGLASTLESLGIIVHRPKPFDQSKFFGTPFWQSNSNNSYNARDLNVVVGNKVIESPSMVHSRYYEPTTYYDIFEGYEKFGFQWIAAPKPRLNYDTLVPMENGGEDRELSSEDQLHKKLTGGRVEVLHKVPDHEILFEAANTLRIGRDLIYLVSSSGNLRGAKWLQEILGPDYKVHTDSKIYRSAHIDSTVLCLRPGLVLLNSTRVNEENCPKIFDSWDKIWFGDESEIAPTSEQELDLQKNIREPIGRQLQKMGFKTNLFDMSSPWVGLNFLSVSEDTVLVEKRQTALIKKLESMKFTVIPVQMRHMYTQGGGIHCATLDTVREGSLESYFD